MTGDPGAPLPVPRDREALQVASLLTEAMNRLTAEAAALRGAFAAAEEDLFVSDLAVALFHSSPDAILVADEAGAIQLVNSQAEFLTGYHRTELRYKPVETLLPERVRDRHASVHRPAFLAEPRLRPMGRGLDLRLRRRNGEEVPVDINLSPVSTERGLLVIVTMRRVWVPASVTAAGGG